MYDVCNVPIWLHYPLRDHTSAPSLVAGLFSPRTRTAPNATIKKGVQDWQVFDTELQQTIAGTVAYCRLFPYLFLIYYYYKY